MRGMDESYGMGAGASVRKGKGKKKVAAKKAASKGNFKPGGSFTSGRAIPKSPGTAKVASKKESNMKKAVIRKANPRGSY